MAFRAVGLQTHIWANNTKSVLLLATFPVLLLLLSFGLITAYVAYAGIAVTLQDGLARAARLLWIGWPLAFAAAGLWFLIAWFAHTAMIRSAVKARPVTRLEQPDLYNLLENLCISRGLSMPKLNLIDTNARNAFASGISAKSYTVTVTRGLMEALDRDELEAVLAHELTHIINRDVRLMMVAIIFVGIFSFIAESLVNVTSRTRRGHRRRRRVRVRWGGSTRRGGRRQSGGGAAPLILIAAVLIGVSYLIALVVRFQLSRKREFLADAGAVELTRNPDAMIGALEKIRGHSKIEAPHDVKGLFIDYPVLGLSGFKRVFATHPPIEKRIEALIQYAGGRRSEPEPPTFTDPDDPLTDDFIGPWER